MPFIAFIHATGARAGHRGAKVNKTWSLSPGAHSLVGRQACQLAVHRGLGATVGLCRDRSPPSCLPRGTRVFHVMPLPGFRMLCPFPLLSVGDARNRGILLLSCLCWTWGRDPRTKLACVVRIPQCVWAEGVSPAGDGGGALLDQCGWGQALEPISAERALPCQHHLKWWVLW